MVGVAQRVEQRLLVGLAAALPGGHGAARVRCRRPARSKRWCSSRSSASSSITPGWRIRYCIGQRARPSRRSSRRVHLGALDQQRQVALAPQQRLEPVDEAQGGVSLQVPSCTHCAGVLHQPAQPQPALVAQRQHPRLLRPRAAAARPARPAVLSSRASLSIGSGTGAAACGSRRARRPGAGRLAVVQQRVEFGGHQFADLAQAVEQFAGLGPAAAQAQAACDPGQVARRPWAAGGSAGRRGTGCGARRGAGRCSRRPAAPRSSAFIRPRAPAGRAPCSVRAGADLGKLAAAHHQQQLDDELDLADAAARQLDVVGALGPAGGAALGLVADLAVQLAQALEDAVVEVAPVDEGGHQRTQRQRAAAADRQPRRHDAALEPGKALPLAALHLQVLLQHGQAHDRRAPSCRWAAAPGRRERRSRRRWCRRSARTAAWRHRRSIRGTMTGRGPAGLAVVLVDVDQVDVGRDIELARAELAHADDPEVAHAAAAHRAARHGVRRPRPRPAPAPAPASPRPARSWSR